MKINKNGIKYCYLFNGGHLKLNTGFYTMFKLIAHSFKPSKG